jgi:hypothetical protein
MNQRNRYSLINYIKFNMTNLSKKELYKTEGGTPWIGRLFVAALAAVTAAGHTAGEVAGEYAYNLGIEV